MFSAYSNPSGDPELEIYWNEVFSLMRCEYCKQPTLLKQNERQADDGLWIEEKSQLFPYQRPAQSVAIPEPIRQAMAEAQKCISAHAPNAAAMRVRRSLEALCSELGVNGRNLARSIEALRNEGQIDQRLFDWANELRLAGNSAAHDVERNANPSDVQDMLLLTEAILDYVFVMQAKYEEFRLRRKNDS